MRTRIGWGFGRVLLSTVLLAACAETPPPQPPPTLAPAPPPTAAPVVEEPVPTLRLPADTRPLAESVELHLDPRQERFSGAVDIDVRLDHPRSVVWLHGIDMHVTVASVTPDGGAPLAATWRERGEGGMASLSLAGVAPAGKARIHVAFDAPFGRGQKGLYRTREAGVDYAFTQFEAIAARLAFPCFDEPGFKIPFTTTLVVPPDMQAVANTREVSRAPDGGEVRVRFAPTLPLPSYLVAFAVGPFDLVSAPDVPANAVRRRPLPLRGVTPRGRGKDMAYALAHTGEFVAILEDYFGIEYPWDKLDILAVPGKGGAMENAGAITFGERLVLFDAASAPVGQRRGYAGVMAHELAHQWTGDLVTMAWWDDTWLNEAFATWLGAKAAQAWDPKLHMDVSAVRGVQGAMGNDALVSARSIRQPIASTHDIENAFDGITYQKGGGVLAMFEHFAGAADWQRGVHAYLEAHRFGNATADDFLDAENTATRRDVKTAFHTFLDQPGVPLLEVSTSECRPTQIKPARELGNIGVVGSASIHVKQSRYLPVGSTGSAGETWQVPFCFRDAAGTSCSLLTQAETDLGARDRRAATRRRVPQRRRRGLLPVRPRAEGPGPRSHAPRHALHPREDRLRGQPARGLRARHDADEGRPRGSCPARRRPRSGGRRGADGVPDDGARLVLRDAPPRRRRGVWARALRPGRSPARLGREEGRGRRDADAAKLGARVPGVDRA